MKSLRKNFGEHAAIFFAAVFLLIFPASAIAYPDAEVLGASDINPPFDYDVTSAYTGFLLTSDRRLVISFAETLSLVDMGSFALESVQPVQPSTDDETDGRIAGIAYISGRNEILAAQEDGDMLLFDLDNLANDPTSATIADGNKLGPVVVDEGSNIAYVADNTAKAVLAVDLSTSTVATSYTLSIIGQSSFTVTDAVYIAATDESYFTTTAGRVFYISGGQLGRIDVDATGAKNLSSVAAFPAGDAIYVVDSTTPAVVRISTSSHAVVKDDIDISRNPGATDVVITQVANPNAIYAYIGGQYVPGGGVSVVNIANDEVLDLGDDTELTGEPMPVSAAPSVLAASSSTDGYVYMGFSTGNMGIITANPFVKFSSVTYSDGGTALKPGQSAAIVFQSNEDGTYTLRAGGDQTGSGTILTDNQGGTSGSITANTDTTVTINYDDNASAFSEGANDLWGFVVSGSNTGRRATTITIDTPPPNVTIRSAGFGNNRIYVNFDRIDVSDMATYNIYIDTDPDAVLTKTDVTAAVAQASSGSTQTAPIDGLTNGTTYYIAMQAADANGNLSPARTNTFADGSVAQGMPEETVGPAGMLGEKGCSLVRTGRDGSWIWIFEMVIAVMAIITFRLRLRYRLRYRLKLEMGDFRRICHSCESRNPVHLFIFFVCAFLILFSSSYSYAQQTGLQEKSVSAMDFSYKESPQMWSIELKAGFWLPQNAVLKSYFSNCCNIISKIEGGLLLKKRYGIEAGAGFLYKSASARGVTSGAVSQDKFDFILVPAETNFVWRADYFSWRYLVPFALAGLDYVYYREGDRGSTTQGVKFGMHGGGGIGINITEFGDVRRSLDSDLGINEFFLTLEARYQWINNFGGKGLDLSGGVYSAGLLFEF